MFPVLVCFVYAVMLYCFEPPEAEPARSPEVLHLNMSNKEKMNRRRQSPLEVPRFDL